MVLYRAGHRTRLRPVQVHNIRPDRLVQRELLVLQRLIHIGNMTRAFVVGVIPRIDTCSAEMLQQQTVAIFLVLIFCAYQATNFFLAKTELLSADGCYATELRVLRRETQELKSVISEPHCVFTHFP